jgi:hypothetical protein
VNLRPGDGIALGSAGLIVSSAVALWMLHRPTSRLSQWLNREIDRAVRLPGGGRW